MSLVTRPEKIPPPPHCMVKSVEVIDGKGVGSAAWYERVRKRLKGQWLVGSGQWRVKKPEKHGAERFAEKSARNG